MVNVKMGLVVVFVALAARGASGARRDFGKRCSEDADCNQQDPNLRSKMFFNFLFEGSLCLKGHLK